MKNLIHVRLVKYGFLFLYFRHLLVQLVNSIAYLLKFGVKVLYSQLEAIVQLQFHRLYLLAKVKLLPKPSVVYVIVFCKQIVQYLLLLVYYQLKLRPLYVKRIVLGKVIVVFHHKFKQCSVPCELLECVVYGKGLFGKTL